MGLEKRSEFDHSKSSVYEAAGYSYDTVKSELEPRAALLADMINVEAGVCPTMTVEVLMDSSILKDSALDDRDRAMIILMAGPVIAAAFVQRLMKEPMRLPMGPCVSKHGFEHQSGKEQFEILKMSREDWERLNTYAERSVLDGPAKLSMSRLVENMEHMLGTRDLDTLQKAVLEAMVARQSAVQAARQITPSSAVIGPLASVGRGSPAAEGTL